MTDDLDAASPRAIAGPGALAVAATAAGNDLLLFAHDPASSQAGVDAVVAAVRSGRLTRSQLLAATRRVLALRRWLG